MSMFSTTTMENAPFLLIIPSVIGMAKTRVNYDLLSYLPEHLETVKGQDILVDEYGMGAVNASFKSFGIISTGRLISATSSYQSTSFTCGTSLR